MSSITDTARNVMEDLTTEGQDHSEGPVARTIEEQTARLPSDTFLWAAGACIGASLFLRIIGRTRDANFVGEWVPTILILGLYNKIVKLGGHDEQDFHQHHMQGQGQSQGSEYAGQNF